MAHDNGFRPPGAWPEQDQKCTDRKSGCFTSPALICAITYSSNSAPLPPCWDVTVLSAVRSAQYGDHSPVTAIQLIGEALRYVARTPTLAGLFLLLLIAGTFGANFNLVLPLFTRVVLHANADTLGYLFAAQGLGSLIGAITMTLAGGFLLEPRRIVLGALLFAAMELAFVIVPGFTQATILLLVIGWSLAVLGYFLTRPD